MPEVYKAEGRNGLRVRDEDSAIYTASSGEPEERVFTLSSEVFTLNPYYYYRCYRNAYRGCGQLTKLTAEFAFSSSYAHGIVYPSVSCAHCGRQAFRVMEITNTNDMSGDIDLNDLSGVFRGRDTGMTLLFHGYIIRYVNDMKQGKGTYVRLSRKYRPPVHRTDPLFDSQYRPFVTVMGGNEASSLSTRSTLAGSNEVNFQVCGKTHMNF